MASAHRHRDHPQTSPLRLPFTVCIIEDRGGCVEARDVEEGWAEKKGETDRSRRRERGGGEGGEAAGSAALIKLAEDNEPVCRLACLAV